LSDVLAEPALDAYAGLKQALAGINSRQMQDQSTLGGELCQGPRCWYYRNGHGLLGDDGRLAREGDHRYHAIFGNAGAAQFVSASRSAPVLIALGAQVRVLGPGKNDDVWVPLDTLYVTPTAEGQRELSLTPGQFMAHVRIPAAAGVASATYEVRHGAGAEAPLASAGVAIEFDGARVASASIVLGQVAPAPWAAPESARFLIGREITPETATAAGDRAVARATPLPGNEYKVQLARTAVKRALLLAAGLETGGF
jgi:xanthine dehydrogenase YagS FAD-binding subunit